MREDLFAEEKDLFGEEQKEADDLFPGFNLSTDIKKEQKSEVSKESQENEG